MDVNYVITFKWNSLDSLTAHSPSNIIANYSKHNFKIPLNTSARQPDRVRLKLLLGHHPATGRKLLISRIDSPPLGGGVKSFLSFESYICIAYVADYLWCDG